VTTSRGCRFAVTEDGSLRLVSIETLPTDNIYRDAGMETALVTRVTGLIGLTSLGMPFYKEVDANGNMLGVLGVPGAINTSEVLFNSVQLGRYAWALVFQG
jgi:hypothetical protein